MFFEGLNNNNKKKKENNNNNNSSNKTTIQQVVQCKTRTIYPHGTFLAPLAVPLGRLSPKITRSVLERCPFLSKISAKSVQQFVCLVCSRRICFQTDRQIANLLSPHYDGEIIDCCMHCSIFIPFVLPWISGLYSRLISRPDHVIARSDIVFTFSFLVRNVSEEWFVPRYE